MNLRRDNSTHSTAHASRPILRDILVRGKLVKVGHVVGALCHLKCNEMLLLDYLSKVARTGSGSVVGCWPEWNGVIIGIGAEIKEVCDDALVLARVDL